VTPALIALIVIALLVVVVVAKSVTIVPQAQAKVVERLGRYSRTLSPGLSLLVPFIDRVRATIDLREQVISFPPQPVITSDNLQVGIDTVVYFQVTEPRLATYGIANYIQGMEQLTTTTLRNVVGGLNLEGALTGRDGINSQLREVLDGTTGPWGLRVARVEIKAIDPPPSIRDSMEKQMRADRDKRAIILTAEGARQSAITTAEGQKASAILSARARSRPRSSRPRPSGRAGSCGPRVSARRCSSGAGPGEVDRDGLPGHPRRQARPGAAGLPVPADAAADRTGRRQQDVDRPERVQQGPRGPGQARRCRRRRAVLDGRRAVAERREPADRGDGHQRLVRVGAAPGRRPARGEDRVVEHRRHRARRPPRTSCPTRRPWPASPRRRPPAAEVQPRP
jgi:regulator of protease activity HflC (stomatin/prohibitin superfamily)